ncbi:hypothetical protein T265_15826, partial [Opisthorchis viverrini]
MQEAVVTTTESQTNLKEDELTMRPLRWGLLVGFGPRDCCEKLLYQDHIDVPFTDKHGSAKIMQGIGATGMKQNEWLLKAIRTDHFGR